MFCFRVFVREVVGQILCRARGLGLYLFLSLYILILFLTKKSFSLCGLFLSGFAFSWQAFILAFFLARFLFRGWCFFGFFLVFSFLLPFGFSISSYRKRLGRFDSIIAVREELLTFLD
jgi:hypothetical protein